MGLDIALYRVLTKTKVKKLKEKYKDLEYDIDVYSKLEEDIPKELHDIRFLSLEKLTSCECNMKFLSKYHNCLTEKVRYWVNVQALLLNQKIKTKDDRLSNYCITSSGTGDRVGYVTYGFENLKNKDDKFELEVSYEDDERLSLGITSYGIYVQEVRYLQRKGLKNWDRLMGKMYTENPYDIYLSDDEQLKVLKSLNQYDDSDLYKIDSLNKYHVINLNW
ncbi:TPA: hypothetical protein SFZ43_000008 [Campylobacter jejuni]|nr:hypothetical protein [Campylobacter jejuni]